MQDRHGELDVELVSACEAQDGTRAAQALHDHLELAGIAHNGVSVRTLHRYIGMLDELGIPIYSERGPQGGFSLVRGYKMNVIGFGWTNAAYLKMGALLKTSGQSAEPIEIPHRECAVQTAVK